MCYDTIWTLLLQPYPNSTTNSKTRKYFFLVPQFLGFIPQSSITRTQTVINIQFCSCWKVEVSSIKIFQSFLTRIVCSQSFLLENFTMVRSLSLTSRWQASILSSEIFTPRWCRILQPVGSSWSCSTEEGMPTSPHILDGSTVPFSNTDVGLNSAA